MKLLIFLFFVVYLLLLLVEHQNAKRNRAALSHVVYVNGTRAKSSISRLIAAGLQAGGYRVLCKTTGTDPMVIHCDGREELLTRRGRANIREQLRILRQAAAERAEILVIECMAVEPRLQWISQHRMLRADRGVITNARLDHTDQMGDTPEDICRSLCSTIPQNGVVFTADQTHAAIIRGEAVRLGSAFVLASPDQLLPEDIDFSENLALALAVCMYLHISRETALAGMAHYRRDPYALSVHRLSNDTLFLNGFSVNDPQSTHKVWLHCKKSLPWKTAVLFFLSTTGRTAAAEASI